MGVYKQFVYSNTGTEIEFMQGLIDLICGLGDGITCEDESGNPTTAQAQYADLTSASTALFYINFGNNVRLMIRRGSTNNNNTTFFYFDDYGHGIGFVRNNQAVMTVIERTCFITYYKNDGIVHFSIGSFDTVRLSDAKHHFMLVKNGSNWLVGRATYPNVPIAQTFTDGEISGTFPILYPYSAGAGHIDYSSSIPFISGGSKQFDCADIMPCSTVAQWASIALPDGKNYLAIGTNAMVELDAEDAS